MNTELIRIKPCFPVKCSPTKMEFSPNFSNSDKATRLVDYLLRLASLRAKVIRDIGDYEKVLWISEIPHERGCFTQAWGRDEEHEPDEWLEVQNRREPELPAAPAQCKDWKDESALRNKNDLPELLSEITKQVPNPNWHEESDEPKTILRTEHLKEHPEIQLAWDHYIEDKWLPWTEEHNAWEKVHDVYSALFTIHQSQLRLGEEYELVLGLGLLTWQTPTNQRVRRHLVTADAALEFEARLGKFIVRPNTDGAKLSAELDMLDSQDQPARAEETATASLAAAEDDPWERGCINGVLQALVHSFSSRGDYDDSLEAKNIRVSEKPVVEYAPALILRKRSARGLTETLKTIKEQIKSGEDIPSEFADLAEIRPKKEHEPAEGMEASNAEFDGEVFFPKPSNDEQRRIVDKIRTASGVLVQGPPGTGKSHTIANLICHLLATGQRTLITAKTPRALQVLEELIPDELRPLCINLLGSGLEERRSLESSVGGILRKNQEWKEDQAIRKRTELEVRLKKLREEGATVNRRLRDIREAETHRQSLADGTYSGTAARIAEAVNHDRSAYEWFTDSVSLDKKCPVSAKDMRTFLAALREFTPAKRKELAATLPEALPSHDCFAILVSNETNAAEEVSYSTQGASERIADLLAQINPTAIEVIRDTFSTFRDVRRRLLASPHPWMNDALRDIQSSNSSLWHELHRVTRDGIASIEKLVAVADETRIEFPKSIDMRSLYEDSCTLRVQIENGGKLGWWFFRPKVVKDRLYVIKNVRINGRPCSTAEHFSNLADAIRVCIECEKAWRYWEGRSEKVQGPYALQLTALKSLRDAVANALTLEELISKCQEAITQCPGMADPIWIDESQVETVVNSCRLALARIRYRLATEAIQSIEAPISRMGAVGSAHPVTDESLEAMHSRDVDGFARCLNRIQDLAKQRQRLQKVDEYLSKMRLLLPQFTKSLEQTCNELCWEKRVQHIGSAWHWAQARYWIEEYIRQDDVPALAKRAKQIEDEINSIIAKLAALHAWSFCFERMAEPHRRHMEAWCKHVNSLTKTGKGKRDFRNRRAAQRSLNECKDAVPAWVMPLHRVWDTIDPSPGMFDVIIIDEASQCGFEALPLLYLGKKVLIVGDDKQISPAGEFQGASPVNKLLEEFLYDFHFKEYFDVNVSLFDHGKLRYGTGKIMLREHFRCMPEIIRYSNDNWYSPPGLIPLRQYGEHRLPPLERIFVKSGYREGSNNRTINRQEADAIVTKIVELCKDDRYESKTMGVVVLQGEAQAAQIESQLLNCLGTDEIERRRLICGNPYSFQGDERDIMLLSMVAAPDVHGQFKEGPTDEKRYNVAMSRARDQVWLFHSVKHNDLSGAYLRKGLLEFFENTKPQQIAGIDRDELERRAAQDNRSLVKPPSPFESWFEVDVSLELLRRNFTVLAQHEIAGKRIDLVVEGGQARLAVECDGDNWHGVDRYEADMQRQRQLERCGWEFFRVRESAFYSNKFDALLRLWQLLEEREIFPTSWSAGASSNLGECVDNCDLADNEFSDNDDTIHDDAPPALETPENGSTQSARRAEHISEKEIEDAIIHALSRCPNQSCTENSLTSRVLREVGVLTRGNPRKEFEKRVIRTLGSLEKRESIELYRAKNKRVRLTRRLFAGLQVHQDK